MSNEFDDNRFSYAYRGGPYENGPMPKSHHDKVLERFGQRLRAARVRAGFKTAKQLADRLGLEPGSYRFYERGQAEPNLATLVRICAELSITTDYLLPTEPTKQVPFPLVGQEPPST